jgi:hypothetical protein
MQTEMTMPTAALYALLALCDEALHQGGAPGGVKLEDIETARAILGDADRIVLTGGAQ